VATVVTAAAGPDWATVTTAIGTVAVAVVAVGVAAFAERRGARRLREEHKRSDNVLAQERALHAKEITEERAVADKRLAEQFVHSDAQLAEERAHSAAQLQENRVWNRRVDLYARISLALRRYVEQPPTGPDGYPVSPADVVELVNLVSEADMLASEPLGDLVNQFVYDNTDTDRQLEIWNTFQQAARAELGVEPIQPPSTGAPGAAPHNLQRGSPTAIQSSDP
jgi:hypothetical protein